MLFVCLSQHTLLRLRLATTTTISTEPCQLADAYQNCSNVDGVAVSTNNEVVTLTNFVNEDCDEVSIRAAARAIPSEIYSDVLNVTDISTYFSRPKHLANFSYTYDNTTSGPLGPSFGLSSQTIRSNLYNPGRMNGAFGFRATICFRLQAICTPFHAGRIKLAYEPLYTAQVLNRGLSVTAISQMPGVELDLAESTSVVLRIPFVHPANYFRVSPDTTLQDFLGLLHIFAITPVALGAGVLAPRTSLWMWLEDFELVGSAAMSVTAQAGSFQRKRDAPTTEVQAIPGNMSNVLSAGANLSLWLGRRIPTISSVTGVAAWAMRHTANIAASYGWAKPIVATVPQKVISTNVIYQHNVDGADSAFSLGATIDNSVSPYVGFAGSDMDEMSFAYLTAISTVVGAGQATITNTTNQVIYACSLSPSSMFYNGTSVNRGNSSTLALGLSIWPSPIFTLSNVFDQWRGGFKFTVKMSKTKFHTGRLILGFQPSMPNSSSLVFTPTTTTDMQFKSVIWDLREGNEIEFECPFTAPQSYLKYDQSFGSFFISVLEPLVGPDTVSTVAPFVVEVAGMSDLEFAVPDSIRLQLAPPETLYLAQSGLFQPLASDTNDQAAQYCIGERLNSVKQLISKAVPASYLVGQDTDVFDDDFVYPKFLPNATAPTSIGSVRNDFTNYFLPLYAFKRGGFCLDIVPVRTDVTVSAYPYVGSAIIDGLPILTESNTALHVKMPYYDVRSRTTTTLSRFSNLRNVFVKCKNDANSQARSAIVYKRAADDYQLGFFICAYPLTRPFLSDSALSVDVKTSLTL